APTRRTSAAGRSASARSAARCRGRHRSPAGARPGRRHRRCATPPIPAAAACRSPRATPAGRDARFRTGRGSTDRPWLRGARSARGRGTRRSAGAARAAAGPPRGARTRRGHRRRARRPRSAARGSSHDQDLYAPVLALRLLRGARVVRPVLAEAGDEQALGREAVRGQELADHGGALGGELQVRTPLAALDRVGVRVPVHADVAARLDQLGDQAAQGLLARLLERRLPRFEQHGAFDLEADAVGALHDLHAVERRDRERRVLLLLELVEGLLQAALQVAHRARLGRGRLESRSVRFDALQAVLQLLLVAEHVVVLRSEGLLLALEAQVLLGADARTENEQGTGAENGEQACHDPSEDAGAKERAGAKQTMPETGCRAKSLAGGSAQFTPPQPVHWARSGDRAALPRGTAAARETDPGRGYGRQPGPSRRGTPAPRGKTGISRRRCRSGRRAACPR